MERRHLHTLTSPLFLCGLCLLLLNDFVFKQQFHNSLTGKLSDFAGLFIFPFFWAALFPRLKLSIYIFTALTFVFWKSGYSQPSIDWWNGLSLFSISRTVDVTDLIALAVLPFSYILTRLASTVWPSRLALCFISAISLFAFTATSYHYEHTYNNQYYFEGSKTELLKRIERLHEISYYSYNPTPENQADKLEIRFDSCFADAEITVSGANGQSVITLNKMDARCPNGKEKREEMQQLFEREFIDKLKELQPTASVVIKSIWFVPTQKESALPSPTLKPSTAPTRKR